MLYGKLIVILIVIIVRASAVTLKLSHAPVCNSEKYTVKYDVQYTGDKSLSQVKWHFSDSGSITFQYQLGVAANDCEEIYITPGNIVAIPVCNNIQINQVLKEYTLSVNWMTEANLPDEWSVSVTFVGGTEFVGDPEEMATSFPIKCSLQRNIISGGIAVICNIYVLLLALLYQSISVC